VSDPHAAGRGQRRGDLRLVPAALTAWTGALVGTAHAPTMHGTDWLWPWSTGGSARPLLTAFVALVLVVLTGVASSAATASPTAIGPFSMRWLGLLTALAVVVGVGAFAAGHGRVAAQAVGPVVGLATDRADVEVQVRLTTDPLPRSLPAGAPAWRQGQVRVSASLVHVVSADPARAPPTRIATPVVVLAPATWQELRPGDLVATTGQLGLPGRPGPAAAVLLARGDPVLLGRSPTLLAVGDKPREALRNSVEDLPPEAGGLLPSLVVGDETLLTEQAREQMRVTGLAHLTAVSGANAS
jgi:competence protein ComEC